ncbi:MAG: SDR family NAD(P)-dependent oxidoreductase [Ferruginibacter sp.]
MNTIVFISGATSGIGKACAHKFAGNGYNVIITGRRKERLLDLKAALESEYSIQVLPLHFDVQNRQEVFHAIENLPEQWKQISILINNAGLALGRDYFDEAAMDDWETMLNTNVHGLIYVTRAVLPVMIANKKGHIINMGSTAGKEVYEKGNMYCASKHAVTALSESMRIDLLRHRIKVTAIHPGAVDTEFSLVRFKDDQPKASAVYKGYTPLHAEDIADTIYHCASLPEHVCINDLVITCTSQANNFYFNKSDI